MTSCLVWGNQEVMLWPHTWTLCASCCKNVSVSTTLIFFPGNWRVFYFCFFVCFKWVLLSEYHTLHHNNDLFMQLDLLNCDSGKILVVAWQQIVFSILRYEIVNYQLWNYFHLLLVPPYSGNLRILTILLCPGVK